MSLFVLTNERDKDGKLIEQLIVTQQEEDYFVRLAEAAFDRKLKAEYKIMGLPCGTDEKDEKRGRIFRSIVFFHNVGRWVLVSFSSVLAIKIGTEFVDHLQIGFKNVTK